MRASADILLRWGRVDEAVGKLASRLHDRVMLRALVEVTEGHGCDQHVLVVLAPIAEEFRRDPE